MAHGTISTTITTSVLLGSANYPSPLTIARGGLVDPAAYGAAGVIAEAAGVRLLNGGSVMGGLGSIYVTPGGIGVDLRSGGDFLSNTGTIAGGHGGNNPGRYYRFYPSTTGGDGVDITSGKISNSGAIFGGHGGEHEPATITYPNYIVGDGGAGVSLEASLLVNSGMVVGGAAGFGFAYAGTGVSLGAGGSVLHNTGLIIGGYGGRPDVGSYAIKAGGGTGVSLIKGDTLVNSGTIEGGRAVDHVSDDSGGTGLALGAGIAVNHGTIIGGAASEPSGIGGIGVTIDGGTLTNFGTIAAGPSGTSEYGYASYAVRFGEAGGALILHPGSEIDGLVLANGTMDDTLDLAGKGGTLTGLGTHFADFTNITEDAGATWTISSFNILDTGTSLHDLATLSIRGSLENGPGGGGEITIGRSGTLSVFGTLGVSVDFTPGAGTLAIGHDGSVTGTLTGFTSGDVIHVLVPVHTLTYAGGTLTLTDSSFSTYTLALAGNYTSANFALAADPHGESDVLYVPNPGSHVPTAPEVAPGHALQEPANWSAGLIAGFHNHL